MTRRKLLSYAKAYLEEALANLSDYLENEETDDPYYKISAMMYAELRNDLNSINQEIEYLEIEVENE